MQTLTLRSVRSLEVKGKRILLRTSLNVPTLPDGSVGDVFRLTRALRTIEFLAGKGARVIVIAHLGREGASLKLVAEKLSSLSTVPITFSGLPFADVVSETNKIAEGHCLVLENVRREKGEETPEHGGDPALASVFASLGEVFVNDAFADSHREHASIVGIPKLLPSFAGLLMEEEVEHLLLALKPPEKSLAIIGGAKFETKEPLITKLVNIYPRICVGGALANDFLQANGSPVGTSLISQAPVPPGLVHNFRILLPRDVLVSDGVNERMAPIAEVAFNERIVDVGPDTARLWGEEIAKSSFVLWNGPLGIYEEGKVAATDALAEALARSGVSGIVGGGDTLAALQKSSFDETRIFRSTGGGAMLQFLAEGTLPGIEPLRL